MKINFLRIAYILTVSIFFIVSCTNKKDKNSINEISIDPTFFSSFSDFNHYAAKFRVGAEMDTTLYHFRIKAITIANFDDKLYRPQSVYILTHQSSDAIVIKTEDTPLISYEEFKRFYNRHKEEMRADTIINSQVFDKFFKIEHNDIVDVESFDHLPFLFLDVNFNGYPALLVRNRYDEGHDFIITKSMV
ncbi:MAG: hypothetical protein K2M83_11650 [Muribaculaceae bacterium]|nr:hypothetical protein [Muribaculaceae bacterium]